MKHILSLLFVLTLCVTEGRAQEVYKLVLANATRTVNSPTSSFTQAQIAQFKRTALVYLKQKAFEQKKEVTTDLLDTQAYYMSEFVTFFIDEILKTKRLSEEKRKERILLFMDASVSNPLFNDPDQETTMSFISSGGELTPFCLNTDWEKAYAAVKSQIK